MGESTSGVAQPVSNGVNKLGGKAAKPKGRKAFARWSLHRNEGGAWKRCYWHDVETGTREQDWDAQAVPPSSALIAARWGSGVYKLTKLDAQRKVAGSESLPAIDSPNHPTRPTYPNPPSAEPKPEPKRQRSPLEEMVQTIAAPAQAQIASMLQGMQLYQQIDQTARAFAAQEADGRVARVVAEMEASRERDRQWFQLQMKHQQQFYEALSKAKTEPSDKIQEQIEELREELDARDDDDGEDDGDPKSMLFRVLKRKLEEVPGDAIGDLISGLGENLKAGKKLTSG